MKKRCEDCGVKEALPNDDLCQECREDMNEFSDRVKVVYKIPWKKYDPKNPPEIGRSYLVSDGHAVDVASFERYWDEEPPRWFPPDRSGIDEFSVFYFATINLPGEDEV
ncbi:hypothetical protein [Paenibacillus sp. XY044]|uniref:hypothetical protein n=1 Tax=Paenibacillus sp. XY044 TaxID=2026089 RepID=UPI000B97D9E7|nr:hypothetical protein [Paenibacillus sp. XY044]OZB90083.1 hypothetical protein CJP46_35485 [Paenibacillus sp. XY044]